MNKKIRWWVLGAVVVGLGLAAKFAIPEASVAVEMHRVERGLIRVSVREEGRTRVRDRYVMAAPISGRLGRIERVAGDAVAVSDVLARVYSAPEAPRDMQIARSQVAAALARVREASALAVEQEASAAHLRREAERSRALASAGALSPQDLAQRERDASAADEQLSVARARVRASQADVSAARALLSGASAEDDGDAVEVHAPVAGTVLRVLEESERVIAAGTPLLEIGDASGIEVVVDVLSADAVRITVGDAVAIDAWGGDTLAGVVRRIEPDAFTEISALGVEEQRVNVIVDLDATPATLGSGYRVEASIFTWTGDDVLVVPTSALLQQDGEWKVFVVGDDGRAALRTIRVGHRSTEDAEVLEGVEEGQQVIAFPSDQIAPGVLVSAAE